MQKSDWERVAGIYAEGIGTGTATFQQKVPSYYEWDKSHLRACRLIVELQNVPIAWAALSLVSKRRVYKGVAEVSLYVGQAHRGKGVGKFLMQGLILCSEIHGYWTLQSSIFPENVGSIQLHEKMGFRMVGVKERIGKLNGCWKDNLIFERRSTIIGL
tara:strand:- start:69917 stop:70390 length:474 start_codon:yes stop_codon:yes gene_type:complete